jgi:hypothetical protein
MIRQWWRRRRERRRNERRQTIAMAWIVAMLRGDDEAAERFRAYLDVDGRGGERS